MRQIGILMFAVVAIAGCGSSTSGGVTHPLPGASQIDIQPGYCITVNAAAPEALPVSVISFDLADAGSGYLDNYLVAAVPSGTACGPDPLEATNLFSLDDTFSGSASDSAQSPAGTYDLDVLCQNTLNDCLISSITWSTTY